MVEFERVPGKCSSSYRKKGRIWTSTGKWSKRVPKKGRIRASIEKDPGVYQERVESRRVPERVRASTREPKKLGKHNNIKKDGVCPSMNMRTPLNDSNKQEIKHLNHERQRGMP